VKGILNEAVYFCIVKFGEGLYAWRLYRGFTQEELAVKADISNITISRFEIKPGDQRDPGEPSARTRSKLAKGLSITPEQFYTLPTAMPERQKSLEDMLDDLRSAYGSGKYTKDQIEQEILEFLLEIKRGESN
jgi:transcriptional regulator with XRE-family HTH domain